MQVKYYIVVNKQGEAFAGLVKGSPSWTHNWDLAKKLQKENTTVLQRYHKEIELLEIWNIQIQKNISWLVLLNQP